jgi:uncharacterized membrane protein (UPF0127 family)
MRININNLKIRVKPMITSKDIQIGMMGREFDNTFEGMIFIMDEGDHCFWMKNCIIPLDIIFINNNKITKIHHNCPPCKTKECDNYCGYGDLVLELPGGYCIKNNIKEADILN